MSAVMRLTLLISLLTFTLSQGKNISSTVKQNQVITNTTLIKTNLETWTSHSADAKQQQVTIVATSQTSALPSQTSTRTQQPYSAVTRHTSKETTPLLSTLSATSTQVTPRQNITTQAPPQEFGEEDLRTNPGLVAIITIFCTIVALALVVATVKCIQSPRGDFERLEDMPMGHGVLEPIPAVSRPEAGDTLNWWTTDCRAQDGQPFTLIPRGNLECPISVLCMFLECGRKSEYPEETHAGPGRPCKLHTGWNFISSCIREISLVAVARQTHKTL
ncbi:putative LOC729966 homolog isoform X2 [Stigmatopora argus]